jgi:feruloyl esterase
MRNGAELARYFQTVLRNAGPGKDGQVRLFLAPGMGHCGGGTGPNQFDKLAVLDTWVTTSKAPDQIVFSKMNAGHVERTRPTCAYPAVAKYNGTGDPDSAGSYSCGK